MQFGYFDDDNKEYVITNPETPAPWSNYLGSTSYGAIITNNAGGYSFYKSAAQGRFMRYRTNAIPMDQPGRYIYIRDRESGDYWSASWQPVCKPPDRFKSVCRHGTAYTVISSEYSGIGMEITYFVPLGREYEYWLCKITNRGQEKRKLRLFTFVEYTSNWHLWMDIVNLQYTQYILSMDVVDGIIDHGTNIYLPPQPDNFEEGGQARHTFMGVAGAKISAFDTDRKIFLGTYGSYAAPHAVRSGECANSIASSDNGCGVLQFDIDLAPDTDKEFVIVMGIGSAADEGRKAVNEAGNIAGVKMQLKELKSYWHERLQGMHVETPDTEFNSMMNMWNPYNCLITYAWSRAASLVYAGERDGLGYRDTVQDLLGVLHLIPDDALKILELMISGQVSTGGALPVVKPFSHKPGEMDCPGETEYRSDDCLWLFNTILAYVKETGNIDFFRKKIPYADKGIDTVIGHMKKAIEFSLSHMGEHGLPCGLSADWNDCLMLGQKGESIFVAFQLRLALDTYIEVSGLLGLDDEKKWAAKQLDILDFNIDKYAWDGNWYLRAYKDDGLKYGTQSDEEGSLWLNPQSWAVYSKHAKGERARAIMKHVSRRLFTEYGLMICDPPYEKAELNVIKATLFNKGTKENGSIFNHTQGWAVIAEAMNGNGNTAYRYYRAYMPATMNSKAEIREIEPYVYCQSTHSSYSPRYGASRLPWLSGAATWAYYAATQYILGIQTGYNGLRIDPCIPSDWDKLRVRRRFRDKLLDIEIINETHVEKGVSRLILNDKEMEGDFIPFNKMLEKNTVKAFM
jgi:N,N'-diacetylchitobiose phosphorylase